MAARPRDKYRTIVTEGSVEGRNVYLVGSSTTDAITATLSQYGNTVTKSQTPTVTAGAYTANDFVGGKLTFDFSSEGNQGGVIISVAITDKGKQDAELELHLFTSLSGSTITDNGAATVVDADLVNFVGAFSTNDSTWRDYADNSAILLPNLGDGFDTLTLEGFLVTRGTPTYASTSDITVIVAALLD